MGVIFITVSRVSEPWHSYLYFLYYFFLPLTCKQYWQAVGVATLLRQHRAFYWREKRRDLSDTNMSLDQTSCKNG